MVEDGEDSLVQASNMTMACSICLDLYLDDCRKDDEDFDEEEETAFYAKKVLESCTLLGELRNTTKT